MATEPVARVAAAFVKRVIAHYGGLNLTFEQLRSAALSAKGKPLGVFSLACRNELRAILRWGQVVPNDQQMNILVCDLSLEYFIRIDAAECDQ